MKTVALLLLLVSTVFAACKKSESPYHSVHAGLKEDFNYKEGSYWIYKDSATGRVDSLYVLDNSTRTGENAGEEYEMIDIELNQKPITPNIPTDVSAWHLHLEDSRCSFVSTHGPYQAGFNLFYPLSDPRNTDMSFFYYSLALAGKEYYHIYAFELGNPGNYAHTDFKNGLVKIEQDQRPAVNEQYVWELQRSKVIK